MAIAFDTTSSVTWSVNATTKNADISAMATGATCYAWVSLGVAQAPATTALTMTGWTRVLENDDASAVLHFALFRRVKVGGDTTFAVSWPTTGTGVILVASYTGLDATTPDEGTVFKSHTSGTSYPTNSVTPNGINRWALMPTLSANTVTWTPDAGLTERLDVNETNNGTSAELADSNGVVTQAAHTYTAVSSGASLFGGAVLAYLIPTQTAPDAVGFLPVGF